jgi:hypothetical protein
MDISTGLCKRESRSREELSEFAQARIRDHQSRIRRLQKSVKLARQAIRKGILYGERSTHN